MATFFNPLNFVIVVVIVVAVLALATLVFYGILRWVRRRITDEANPD